jgi:hypothetical protein
MNAEWIEILDRVYELHQQISEAGNSPWYRGHTCASWFLRSSLHRHVIDMLQASEQKLSEQENRQLLRDEYKSLYFMFRADAWALLQPHERFEWSIVFAMQHHDVPTRLLDWSESFACALYFALLKRPPNTASAVFVLDPAALNELAIGERTLVSLDDELMSSGRIPTQSWHPHVDPPDKDLPTIAVAPILSNRRMVAQRAAFTVSGDSFAPLDEQYPSALTKIVIPQAVQPDAEAFLALAGVDAFGYFPDLDGLARKFRARRDTIMSRIVGAG